MCTSNVEKASFQFMHICRLRERKRWMELRTHHLSKQKTNPKIHFLFQFLKWNCTAALISPILAASALYTIHSSMFMAQDRVEHTGLALFYTLIN